MFPSQLKSQIISVHRDCYWLYKVSVTQNCRPLVNGTPYLYFGHITQLDLLHELHPHLTRNQTCLLKIFLLVVTLPIWPGFRPSCKKTKNTSKTIILRKTLRVREQHGLCFAKQICSHRCFTLRCLKGAFYSKTTSMHKMDALILNVHLSY